MCLWLHRLPTAGRKSQITLASAWTSIMRVELLTVSTWPSRNLRSLAVLTTATKGSSLLLHFFQQAHFSSGQVYHSSSLSSESISSCCWFSPGSCSFLFFLWHPLLCAFGIFWYYNAYNLRSVTFKFFKILKVFILAARMHRLLPYGHRTVIVRRPHDWHHTVRRPCAALTGAARSPYGRLAACSQAPYDGIQEFLTGAARRLEICDRVGYGRREIVYDV